ncbi:hypothetical protein OIM90_06355 [Streptomyces sp. AD16]|nr:hypothetical protein OIM90_06355 [Streptomyces sp. AD16]
MADDQCDEERLEDVGMGLVPEQFLQQFATERGAGGLLRGRHEGRQRGTDGGRPRTERGADQRADLRVGPAPRQAAFGVRRDVARRAGARPEKFPANAVAGAATAGAVSSASTWSTSPTWLPGAARRRR